MNTDIEKTELAALSYPHSSVTSVSSMATPLPLPAARIAMRVRVATLDDIPFMDALQKKHSKALGFFPRQQMEGYVTAGNVLIAEEGSGARGQGSENVESEPSSLSPDPRPLTPLGYVAYRDRYLKRDELGVIYQMCVTEAARGKLVAANLLKAAFDRSPRGCKLYCCWCAQDLAANKFWEAMGFQAIAFRSGGARGKGSAVRKDKGDSALTPGPRPLTPRVRTHIYWQKRIRDDETPYWYPSETGGGAIKENRLVLPVPMGVKWDEEMPVLLPLPLEGQQAVSGRGEGLTLASDAKKTKAPRRSVRPHPRPLPGGEVIRKTNPSMTRALSRPGFGPPATETAIVVAPLPEKGPREKKPREKKAATKNDPALVKKARDLRDRWFEHVNTDPHALGQGAAKYAIAGADGPAIADALIDVTPLKLLAA